METKLQSSLQSVEDDFIKLTTDVIDIVKMIEFLNSTKSGAIVTFNGVTRDSFEGKRVHSLEYEAYEPMALRWMQDIVQEIRHRWNVLRVYIVHRLGRVDPGETSVVIGVGSVHRREALEAVEFGIEALKVYVPIWKKEEYGEDGSTWKANESTKGEVSTAVATKCPLGEFFR